MGEWSEAKKWSEACRRPAQHERPVAEEQEGVVAEEVHRRRASCEYVYPHCFS